MVASDLTDLTMCHAEGHGNAPRSNATALFALLLARSQTTTSRNVDMTEEIVARATASM